MLRPALAANWERLDGGRTVRFHLRQGLTFSDGSPLTGADVVRSWLRLLDPAHPSPLASLASDIVGADAYRRGMRPDASAVGLSATAETVEVRLVRPADFPSIVASPSFAVVPASIDRYSLSDPTGFVGSGAYVVTAIDGTEITLAANRRYWAGTPAITTVHVIYDIGGISPVEAFTDKQVDYAPVAAIDASWIGWDRALGPQLVSAKDLSLEYYGFNTTRPPFDNPSVRQAFARAVDWRRIGGLSGADEATPATGMVPEGIPGRSSADMLPPFDPAAARALLEKAGYPGGAGLPSIQLLSGGSGSSGAVAAQLRDNLGVSVNVEVSSFADFFARLENDPPQMWFLGWIADYPSPNDFLGVLLGSDAPTNYTRWSSAAFDAAIAEAAASPDVASARAAYERAERIVRDESPAIPVSYGRSYALVRSGLLGAGQSGNGILRYASLAWAQ